MNLSVLNYKDKIEIDEKIELPKDIYAKSDILDLKNISIKGYIRMNSYDKYDAYIEVNGQMYLEDCISLERKMHEFSFIIDDEIPENLINSQNMLDINEFLWQNIVLEVPIRFTDSDADNMKGENWKVIDENALEKEIDPRMQKLYDLYKGGE